MAWKQCPCLDKSDAFIARVYNEDINLCLNFNNKELGARVQDAIDRGNIYIEAVSDKTKTVFPKQVLCSMLAFILCPVPFFIFIFFFFYIMMSSVRKFDKY
jgi:Rab-3A-interacting protein